MPGVMAYPRQSRDDGRHPGQCPEVRAESVHARPRAQRLFDRRQLRRPELGLAPRAARRLEPRAPVGVPRVIPVVGRHRRDPQRPRHRSLRLAPREQPCRLEPTGFQRGKIPARTRWSDHASACDSTREIL
jgi:hypothetical protein